MCHEVRGLSGWPRKAARWAMLAMAATLALTVFVLTQGRVRARAADEPPPASAEEPLAPAYSSSKAAAFLDAVALDWTRKRQCGTCHTNYAYMISRSALAEPAPAQAEVRAFFEERVAHWDDEPKEAKPRWDAEVVATSCALALDDAATTRKLSPRTRQALDRIWTLQKPDGSWNWLKCDWPPYEHDDYYGAVFAAVGVGAAPEGYAQSESASAGVVRLRSYLRKTEPPDLHHKTFLLWAEAKLGGVTTPETKNETIAALRALQRADGGWSLPSLGDWKRRDGSPNAKDVPSDGYATGLVVFVLRQAGVPASDPALERGVAWLKSHQRASGRWFTRSLNNDKAHYIANAGTGFAVMALRACESVDAETGGGD